MIRCNSCLYSVISGLGFDNVEEINSAIRFQIVTECPSYISIGVFRCNVDSAKRQQSSAIIPRVLISEEAMHHL